MSTIYLVLITIASFMTGYSYSAFTHSHGAQSLVWYLTMLFMFGMTMVSAWLYITAP